MVTTELSRFDPLVCRVGVSDSQERAILVFDYSRKDYDLSSSEFVSLAVSAGAYICGSIRTTRGRADTKTFITLGKLDELKSLVESECASVVIVESQISPVQERNLQTALNCRVIDRVRLILDIFALRARTREGKLQVELAQLKHLSTRLVRGWTHLERQRGGIGLRGPGETQLETDRRLIGIRLKKLRKQLDSVQSQRQLHRRRRQRKPIPLISLVGYTNSGKSSLFNRLTNSNVYVADQLFATLDPTIRRIELQGYGPLLLSDTVGFVRKLPHTLIEAFRATLEEVRESQLLVHVVDTSESDFREHIEEVEEVLKEIGACEIPRVIVFNKIDLTGELPRVQKSTNGQDVKIWLSAATGAGLDLMHQVFLEQIASEHRVRRLRLGIESGRSRARIYQLAEVRTEAVDQDGNYLLDVYVDRATEGRLNALFESDRGLSWVG
ncbi:MAG: GTPase HflX [Acidiferrobacteraceae bacterium]|nr:GTPase HflX [Acidiferrobacteraceae bacterium]